MTKIKTYRFRWVIDDKEDTTEFCARNIDEATQLFDEFCNEEDITIDTAEVDLIWSYDDFKEYGDDYVTLDMHLERIADHVAEWTITQEDIG